MQSLPSPSENENNQFIALPRIQQMQKEVAQSIQEVEIKRQVGPFFQYFVQKAKDEQKFKEVEQKYNKNVEKKLHKQIQEGKTTVSNKKNFKLITNKQETELEKYLRDKHHLERKKKIFQESLTTVLEEEKKLLQKNPTSARNTTKRNQPQFQEMNPKQKQDVFLSLKKLKHFEEILKQKDKSLEGKIDNLRLRDIVNKTKLIDAIRSRNRSQILQKKQKYQALKEKEINQRKKCQLQVLKIKPQSYKFQKVEQMRRMQLQRIQSQRKIQQESLRKQRTTLSRKQLEAHEQTYLQIITQRKQRWISQFQQNKAANRAQARHYSGFFLQKVIREQGKKREQIQEKQEGKIQAIKKTKNYSQYVKDCFRPKVTTVLNPEKQGKNRLSLTRIQERIKGIENLNFVKEKINSTKKPTEKQKSNVQKTMSLPKLNSKTVYKDYLKEQPSRINRELSMKSGFETILTERKSEWLQNAYDYIGKLETKEATKKGKPLIETVFRKLQLLNALY